MVNEENISNVKNLILSSDESNIKYIISNMKSADAQYFLKNFTPSEQVYLLTLFKNPSKVFVELNIEEQKQLLALMEDKYIASLLEDMNTDDRTYIFERLDSILSKKLFNL